MLGWDTIEELHHGTRSALIRARRQQDGATHVLKQSLLPGAPAALEALEREQRVLSVLVGCEGVIRSFGVAQGPAHGALLLENFEGESLAKRLLRGRILPANALTLALAILTTLSKVHSRGIVHGALCPENVLLASDGNCRLIDFASAVPIGSAPPKAAHPASSARAIASAAPEQVARGERRVDRRTDYYRFGTLLYESLTGKPLFEGVDSAELTLSHGARLPAPPRELVPEISPALERVVLKLLAKDPDARYQSEARLRDALECCRAAARRGDRSFDGLSTDAEAPGLVPTERLFGRDAVLSRAERSTERALRGQRQLVVLEGPAGIGKSALAEQLGRKIRARNGFFVRIAFDVEHGADPGLPLQRALEALAEQLDQFAGPQALALGERLERRYPGASGALVACCPALSAALPSAMPAELREGSVEPVPRALGELLRVLSEQGPPVCLFVDDLQWIPESAWRAVRALLAAAESAPFALIVAHRTDDDDESQRSRALLAELTAHGYATTSEKLEPMGRAHVKALLSASLTEQAADLGALDELLWKWSLGNPLLAHILLEAMAQRCVAFDAHGRPYVELGRARSLLAEGNLDALLAQRLRALPADTRHALEFAACLGSSFELAIIAALPGDLLACLAPAVSAGLLCTAAHTGSLQLPARARFAHERARAVVSEGLAGDELAARHLELGRVYVQRLSLGHDRRALFAAVEHLERARTLLTGAEPAELATLQLRATREATRAGHGDLALTLAHRVGAALAAGNFEIGPARLRAVLLAQAEAAFAWGDQEVLSSVLEALRAHAIEPQQLADALTLEGRIHEAQHRQPKAVELYAQALAVLRAPIGERPSEREVAVERERTTTLLRDSSDRAILALTECRDERVRRELYLLGKLVLASGSANHDQLAIAACRIIRHSLRHGHAPESACGYALFAQLCARERDAAQATRYARIALELAERFGSASVLAHVQLHVTTQLLHLTQPFKRLVPQLSRAHQAALAAGASGHAASSATTLDFARLWSGEPLNAVWDALNEHRELLRQLKQKPMLNAHAAWMQLVHQLREPAQPADRLAGVYYNDADHGTQLRDADDAINLLHTSLARAMLAVVYRVPGAALAALSECEALTAAHGDSSWVVPLRVLDAMARLLAYASVPEEQRARESDHIRASIEELTRFAANNPEEGEPRLRIVMGLEAERVGNTQRAAQLLEEAVELTAREGPAWEAVASECTARFWLAQGQHEKAGEFLRRAHEAYLAWGAHGKVSALQHELPDLLGTAPAARTKSNLTASDLHRVIDATRAIAGELRLSPLLESVSGALSRLVDAERGYILLRTEGAWQPDAKLGLDGELVQRVVRSGEPVRLREREGTGRGVARHVVCVPFTRDGVLEAIVYLARADAREPFSRESVAMLELLGQQVVSALAHARAVEQLDQALELARS